MKKAVLILITCLLLFCLSCNKPPKVNVIKIGYTDFSFDQSIVMVLKGILDQQQNIEVELYRLPDSTMFRVLSTGEIDIAISGWLPNTHGEYEDEYARQIKPYSMLCDSLGVYMVVPQTCVLNTIDELTLEGVAMNHTVVIPESQNAIYHLGKDVLTDYELHNFKLQESTWDDIITLIDNSLKNNSDFAFVGLRPHWIFKRYALKTLQDPKNSLGRYEKAYLFMNLDFPNRVPVLADFFGNVRFTLKDIEYIMELNQTLGSEPYENALKWINENMDKINQWLTG